MFPPNTKCNPIRPPTNLTTHLGGIYLRSVYLRIINFCTYEEFVFLRIINLSNNYQFIYEVAPGSLWRRQAAPGCSRGLLETPGGLWRPLCVSGGILGGLLGAPGGLLGASGRHWVLLAASWGPLGALWRPLGDSGGPLGASSMLLGNPWVLGAFWWPLAASGGLQVASGNSWRPVATPTKTTRKKP